MKFKEKLQTSDERKIDDKLNKQLQQMINESNEKRKSEKFQVVLYLFYQSQRVLSYLVMENKM